MSLLIHDNSVHIRANELNEFSRLTIQPQTPSRFSTFISVPLQTFTGKQHFRGLWEPPVLQQCEITNVQINFRSDWKEENL